MLGILNCTSKPHHLDQIAAQVIATILFGLKTERGSAPAQHMSTRIQTYRSGRADGQSYTLNTTLSCQSCRKATLAVVWKIDHAKGLGSQGALRRSQLSSTAQRRTCSTSICLTLTFTQQHHDGPAERKRWPGALV